MVKGGFFAGREDGLLGSAPSNQLGHFEPLSALDFNEALLRRFGCTWWSDAPTPEFQLPYRDEVVPQLRKIVQSILAESEGAPIVIKEPRISGLLPLWSPVIEEFLHPLLVTRDPVEIALSHLKRDGTSTAHALAAWETQTTLLLEWLDGRSVTIASYEELTANPELAVTIVSDATRHLDPERALKVQPSEAAAGVKANLRHERSSGLDHRAYMTGRQGDLWSFLRRLKSGSAQLQVPAGLRRPNTASRILMRKESERIQFFERRTALESELAAIKARLTEVEQRLDCKDGPPAP